MFRACFACCGCGDVDNKKALMPPPPPPGRERSISTAGSEASALSRGTENARRRKLFDLLCANTDKTFHGLGAKKTMHRELEIAKVEPYLKSLTDATIINEMWVVFRMTTKIPTNSNHAINELIKVLEKMDMEKNGLITYESYSRLIQRSVSQSSLKSSQNGLNDDGMRRSSDVGFDGSIVGIDPRQVKADAKILIVRMKEIRLPEKFDPYVKLSLICPFAEKHFGKQLKQTAVHGSTHKVIYDPPQFFGFVCDNNVNKTKLILTVVDKNVLSADQVIGSCVVNLKKLPHVKGNSHEEDNVEVMLTDVETGEELDGAHVNIGVRMVSKSKGFGFGIEQVFEYERWQIGIDFGNSNDHFMPTDPGQWSDEHGDFFWSLDEASRQLPSGWKADPSVTP